MPHRRAGPPRKEGTQASAAGECVLLTHGVQRQQTKQWSRVRLVKQWHKSEIQAYDGAARDDDVNEEGLGALADCRLKLKV